MAVRDLATEQGYVTTDDSQRVCALEGMYFVDLDGEAPPPATNSTVRLIGGVLCRSPLLQSRLVGEL